MKKSDVELMPCSFPGAGALHAARTLNFAHPLNLILAGLVGISTGCHPAKPKEISPAPKVTGERIEFAADARQVEAIAAETVQPHRRSVAHLSGRLVWDEGVTVRVFSPVGGRVKDAAANLGQWVPPGSVLARIDSPDFGQAQADARKASADLVLAERTLNRLRDLLAHGAAAQKDVESAEDAYASAVSEKARANARLALYGGTSESADQLYPLKTAIGGVVVERNLNPGQEVRPDQMLANAPQLFAPLFVISDPTHLWLWLDATELDMALLQPGLEIQIHSPAYPDRTFPGRLEVIGDSLDPTTRTVKARGSVSNPDKLLKAEMYVTVDVTKDQAGGVDIPPRAVFMNQDSEYRVFVELARGRYERRAVRAGPENDGKIVILEGLQPGERVVTEGCLLLRQLVEAGDKT